MNSVKKRGMILVKVEEGEPVHMTPQEISVLYPTKMIEIVDDREGVFCAACLGGVVEFRVFAHGRKHRVGWCNKCDSTTMIDENSNAIMVKEGRYGQFKYLGKYNI